MADLSELGFATEADVLAAMETFTEDDQTWVHLTGPDLQVTFWGWNVGLFATLEDGWLIL